MASHQKAIPTGFFKGRVAIITGGSRGIGRECALTLARLGCNIVIAAKTVKPHPTLPGTIHTVAAEVEALGVKALAFQLDLRNADAIEACAAATVEKFGRIDILINNASALWWQPIEKTPPNKFDLIMSINARGTFLMTKACLPHMAKRDFGRVITMSPPIVRHIQAYSGRTAYNISKFGMTMVTLGVAAEYGDNNITANSLWPATIIESLASKNFKMGHTSLWRKASIIADAAVRILAEPGSFSGNMLIDDTFLKTRWGFTDEDMVQYRYDPETEPPRLLALEAEEKGRETEGWGELFHRGAVKEVAKDMESDRIPSKL